MKRKWIILNLVMAVGILWLEGLLIGQSASEAGPAAVPQTVVLSEQYADPAYPYYLKLQEASNTHETVGAENLVTEFVQDVPETPETEQTLVESEPAVPVNVMADSGILTIMEQAILRAGLSVSQVLDYDWLLPNFYVVHPGTSMPEEVLNPEVLLAQDLRVRGSAEEPQILIYHTHSQEAYIDSIPGDKSQTIVGVGDYLTELLTEKYGYHVIHHTGEYDVTNGQLDRDPAYSKALPAIEAILAEYPSIECVIDLHRDGVGETVRLVTDVNGQPTAQIMWFNGVCRNETEFYPDLKHPWITTNLAFSLQLRLAAMGSYPGLTRVNYLKSMRYNQHLGMSALIEVGAQTNTVSEAMNAMPPLADIIDQVLSGTLEN